MAYLGFDATAVTPASDFSALPAGEYAVIITSTEMATTKRGDGQMLKLTLEVIEGQHKGRLLWARLNLNNPNPKVVDIAQRELSAICHAVGKTYIKDSDELCNLPLRVKVNYVPVRDQYPESNEIKAWKAYNSAPSASPASAFKAVPVAPATTAAPIPSAAKDSKTPPWKRAAAAPAAPADSIDADITF
jgi:hypothetical protein